MQEQGLAFAGAAKTRAFTVALLGFLDSQLGQAEQEKCEVLASHFH